MDYRFDHRAGLAPALTAIIALVAQSSLVLADVNHTGHRAAPARAHDAGTKAGEAAFVSVGEAWTILQASVTLIEELAKGADLKALHEPAEKVTTALVYLEGNSPMVTGDKQKRLASALTQASAIAANVHSSSDAGDKERTEKEVKKLQAALKLVAVQYPADALQAPASAVKYKCPMNDFVGDAPGECPKCGMELKAVMEGETDHGAVPDHAAPNRR